LSAYSSFVDQGVTNGRVGFVGLTSSGHFTHNVVTCELSVQCKTGKVRWPGTDVLTTVLGTLCRRFNVFHFPMIV